jgi:hypothetical protein
MKVKTTFEDSATSVTARAGLYVKTAGAVESTMANWYVVPLKPAYSLVLRLPSSITPGAMVTVYCTESRRSEFGLIVQTLLAKVTWESPTTIVIAEVFRSILVDGVRVIFPIPAATVSMKVKTMFEDSATSMEARGGLNFGAVESTMANWYVVPLRPAYA